MGVEGQTGGISGGLRWYSQVFAVFTQVFGLGERKLEPAGGRA